MSTKPWTQMNFVDENANRIPVCGPGHAANGNKMNNSRVADCENEHHAELSFSTTITDSTIDTQPHAFCVVLSALLLTRDASADIARCGQRLPLLGELPSMSREPRGAFIQASVSNSGSSAENCLVMLTSAPTSCDGAGPATSDISNFKMPAGDRILPHLKEESAAALQPESEGQAEAAAHFLIATLPPVVADRPNSPSPLIAPGFADLRSSYVLPLRKNTPKQSQSAARARRNAANAVAGSASEPAELPCRAPSARATEARLGLYAFLYFWRPPQSARHVTFRPSAPGNAVAKDRRWTQLLKEFLPLEAGRLGAVRKPHWAALQVKLRSLNCPLNCLTERHPPAWRGGNPESSERFALRIPQRSIHPRSGEFPCEGWKRGSAAKVRTTRPRFVKTLRDIRAVAGFRS